MVTEHNENRIAPQAEPGATGETKRKYDRSTIEFPYNDLDDAVELVQAIQANAGQKCTIAQLAGYVHQSKTSGAFRGRVSNAGTFHLAKVASGEIALTELGRRIVDAALEGSARAEAFLEVPLYREIFEKYDGYQLPPASAMEREMLTLGVAQKQTGKARQVLVRSARQAGFFAHGENRLIQPAVRGPGTMPLDDSKREKPRGGGGGGGGAGSDPLHPLIRGLIDALPDPGTPWSISQRAMWLKATAMNLNIIYSTNEDEDDEIIITRKSGPS